MQNQSKLNRSWSKEEDDKLRRQIINGTVKPNWEAVAKESGLKRSANSCRLRWINQLKPGYRPDCKLTDEEKLLILEYRHEYGKNRWARIAKNLLLGRRDNDVKNYWHSLAKRAKREGREVDGDAFRKRAELVETIRAAGKFTMDYSSSIRADAFEKLKELFPDLATAGGGAVAEAAASSSITRAVSSALSNDLASSSAATDIGAADAAASGYSVEFGPGRVGNSDFANTGSTAEVEQVILREQFRFNYPSNPTEIGNPGEVNSSGLDDHGGGATGFEQVPAAFGNTSTETSNQGWMQMQDSVPAAWNTFDDAPQFHAPAEQHQQLGFNGVDFYLGGGLTDLSQATAAASQNNRQFY